MWEQSSDTNVIKGLISRPSDADGVDTFEFGFHPDFTHDFCAGQCAAQAGCVAYTKFASWYSDSNFRNACVGRSIRYNILEPDSATISGVMAGEGLVHTTLHLIIILFLISKLCCMFFK